MAQSPQLRAEIQRRIAELDDEAFSWLVVALLPKAATHGYSNVQIWPDGLGGFHGREAIERLRDAAAKYVR